MNKNNHQCGPRKNQCGFSAEIADFSAEIARNRRNSRSQRPPLGKFSLGGSQPPRAMGFMYVAEQNTRSQFLLQRKTKIENV
jgi:hypothetical protein